MVYRRRRYYRRRRSPVYRRRFKRGPGYRRRSYRRFRRRARAFAPKVGTYAGWPEISYCKHVWRDSYRVSPLAINGNTINFAAAIRCNSVWDPWLGVDVQNVPSRFTEMSTVYNRHTVLGSKISVIISGPTKHSAGGPVRTDQTEFLAVMRRDDDSGSYYNTDTDTFMATQDRKNRWKRCQLAPMLAVVGATTVAGGDCQNTSVKLTASWSLKKDGGCSDPSEPEWGASGSANPSKERFYMFGLAHADSAGQSTSPGYLVEVRVEYFVRWTDQKDLSHEKA